MAWYLVIKSSYLLCDEHGRRTGTSTHGSFGGFNHNISMDLGVDNMELSLKLIITFSMIILQIPLFYLSFQRLIKEKKCKDSSRSTEGILRSSKSAQNVNVEYEVKSKTYKKNYIKKPCCNLNEGDKILINYLETDPKFSYPQSYQVHNLSLEYTVFAIVFLFIANLLMGVAMYSNKETFDNLFHLIIYGGIVIAILTYFIRERKFIKNAQITKGKIVAKCTLKKNEIFVAEYVVKEKKHYTREMKIPRKLCDEPLEINDEVKVNYLPNKPHCAIISNDICPFRIARKLLVGAAITALILIILYLIH